MARRAVGLNIPSTVIGRGGFTGGGHVADPVNTVATTATAAALADVVTDVGVLVADAATPTQAHVNTLNGHLTTLNTAWAALLVGTSSTTAADVVLSYDPAKVGNLSVLEAAIRQLLVGIRSSDDFAH